MVESITSLPSAIREGRWYDVGAGMTDLALLARGAVSGARLVGGPANRLIRLLPRAGPAGEGAYQWSRTAQTRGMYGLALPRVLLRTPVRARIPAVPREIGFVREIRGRDGALRYGQFDSFGRRLTLTEEAFTGLAARRAQARVDLPHLLGTPPERFHRWLVARGESTFDVMLHEVQHTVQWPNVGDTPVLSIGRMLTYNSMPYAFNPIEFGVAGRSLRLGLLPSFEFEVAHGLGAPGWAARRRIPLAAGALLHEGGRRVLPQPGDAQRGAGMSTAMEPGGRPPAEGVGDHSQVGDPPNARIESPGAASVAPPVARGAGIAPTEEITGQQPGSQASESPAGGAAEPQDGSSTHARTGNAREPARSTNAAPPSETVETTAEGDRDLQRDLLGLADELRRREGLPLREIGTAILPAGPAGDASRSAASHDSAGSMPSQPAPSRPIPVGTEASRKPAPSASLAGYPFAGSSRSAPTSPPPSAMPVQPHKNPFTDPAKFGGQAGMP